MDEKKTIEKHWKKYKERRSNGILLLVYCLLFVGLGAIVLLGGIGGFCIKSGDELKDIVGCIKSGVNSGAW